VVIENRVYSGTGDLRWMQFVNRGFFDSDGKLLEIQSVGRDITDRKATELSLKEAHEQLERRVRERTSDLQRLAVEATLAEERERQAIARDLHDDLGQLLHIVKIKLDAVSGNQTGAHDAIGELNSLVTEASRLVRSLTSQLSPPVLKSLGLLPALRWLGEELQRQYGLQVAIDYGNLRQPLPISPAGAAILFRAARELLINVVKHSGTMQARLEVENTETQLRLTVTDSGIGIADRENAFDGKTGFGLASVRERLTFLGGGLDLAAPANGGLSISLHLPVTSAHNAADGAKT
jgi:signal transduction histidine kinase